MDSIKVAVSKMAIMNFYEILWSFMVQRFTHANEPLQAAVPHHLRHISR